MSQAVTHATVVAGGTKPSHQAGMSLSLVNPDGTAFGGVVGLVTTGSAIGTVGKTTTASEPPAGSIVPVKFTNGNSAASVTLAFAGGSARAIQLGGVATPAADLDVAANGVVLFYFDGTVLHQFGSVTSP